MVRTGLFYLTSLHWFLADGNTKLITPEVSVERGKKKKQGQKLVLMQVLLEIKSREYSLEHHLHNLKYGTKIVFFPHTCSPKDR